MTLRRRLLLLVLGLSAAGLAVTGVVSVLLLRNYVMDRVDRQLVSFAADPSSTPLEQRRGGVLTCPDDDHGFGVPVKENPDGIVSQVYLDGIVKCGQRFSADPGGGPQLDVGADLTRTGIFSRPGAKDGHDYRVKARTQTVGLANGGSAQLSVVYAIDMGDARTTWQNQALATGIVGGITLLVLGGAALVLVRRDLRPLEQVTEAAEEIATGDLSRRVEIPPSSSEVGRLGSAFNTMVSSIETAFGEQQRSEQKLRRFVADASHELRTPLTSIRGYAELERVGGADTPDKRATVMHHIEREATRMTGLVEDLLLLAKLDEEPPLRLAPVDLTRLAADAVHDLQAVEPDRPVELASTESLEVVADEARLRQVLTNLLANVRSHTPRGTPVRVEVTRLADQAVIRVSDRGPGIPPDKVDTVFERFARLDPSRARTSGGSGLGLAIVKALVEAHRGRVWVEDTPGGGATFVVRLPLRPAEAAPLAPPDPSARVGAVGAGAPGGPFTTTSQPPRGVVLPSVPRMGGIGPDDGGTTP